VVRKSAEFDFVATRAIEESTGSGRALQNLYGLEVADKAKVEGKIEEALNRETSEDDTHPGPNDRFRFTRRVTSQSEPPIAGMVWDLFEDKDGLTREMTSMVEQHIQ
jgi:hypothetical protein